VSFPITVIAFDLFGTVFDLSGVSHQEIKDYVAHIRQPEWSPLQLPKSWEHLPAHPDSSEGLERLRRKFFVVTCSNGPLGLTAKLSKNAGIRWDCIIPLELNRVYKTNFRAYMTVCEILSVSPQQVMMVTANKDFGDLEASVALGMTSMLIRGTDGPQTIIELAASLGC
jgi:2-haloalkanoic acid dehalogenase type II